MISIRWCLQQKDGLQLIEPNENMAISYLYMAEESISTLQGAEKSKLWTATMTYYIFYYSLYAFMIRMGVKCEIHSCSLVFMQQFLKEVYTQQDMTMIKKAFSARSDLQYYTDRPVKEEIIEETKRYCKDFYIKTKDVLAKLSEQQIETIRNDLISYRNQFKDMKRKR